MPSNKTIGFILLIAGVGIAAWGYQMSGSAGSQIGAALSGSPTDDVMYRYIAGGLLASVGALLASRK
jgi:hypothetical protein